MRQNSNYRIWRNVKPLESYLKTINTNALILIYIILIFHIFYLIFLSNLFIFKNSNNRYCYDSAYK